MAQLHHSVAALSIFGDALDPDHISRLLGGVPTVSFRKGDVKPSKTQNIVRKSGGWILNATDQEPGNLDKQIEKYLGS